MMHEKKLPKIYLVCLIILSIVFVCLYHQFIFSDQIYAYSDVGADTIDQYLPGIIYETNQIRQGLTEEYDLRYGLGKYSGGYLLKYFNPVNLPLLLLGEENLPAALMISLYLKYALICLFALLFFNRLLGNEKTAGACALLWTFSGYAVLWGQHYQFLTAILCFTVTVYCFQLFLEEDKKAFWVVPAVAYLAGTSYYHLYVACFFLLFYGVLYLVFRGKKAGYIFKRMGIFLLGMVIAALMAGHYLLPAIMRFLDSPRAGQVKEGLYGSSLVYPTANLMAFLSRVLSNDLFGVGDEFLGPTNYYECAVLCVSVLFLFALVYLLLSRYWKKTLFISAVCVGALCTPLFSRIIVFSTDAMRWTYLLCFGEVIAIGFALTDIANRHREEGFQKVILRAVIGADALLGLMLAVLYRYHVYVGGWLLNKKALVILGITVVMYHIVLLLMKKSRRAFVLLMAAVAVELVMTNYASVNQRQTVSLEQWQEDMYYDGTAEVVQWILEQDDSLYRINKTYNSVYYCDSLVQDYSGMGVYYSLNSTELIGLAKSYGYAWAGNRVNFDATNYLASSMLSVKYIISEENTQMDPVFYEEIYNDGTYKVYRNRYWLGFGHLYTEQMDADAVSEGTALEKLMLMSAYCYQTDSQDTAPSVQAQAQTQTVDLLPMLTGALQCQVEQQDEVLSVYGTGVGMQLYFTLPQIDDGLMVAGVRVRMNAQNASAITLHTSADGITFEETLCYTAYYSAGEVEVDLSSMAPSGVTAVRLDVSWAPQNLTVEEVSLILVDREALCGNLQTLQMTGVANMVQQGNTFAAQVTNDGTSDAVLCVPLVYSEKWTAEVDGQPVSLMDLNGGLLGLQITPGVHTVEFIYRDSNNTVGMWLSFISSAVYLFAVLAWMKTASKCNSLKNRNFGRKNKL